MDRIISSFLKSSSKFIIGFSICIIILSVGAYSIGEAVEPKDIFVFAWIFLCMDMISTIEQSLHEWNKWMNIPYWARRIIGMPFYMSIIIIGITNIGIININIRLNVILLLTIGIVVYVISSFVKYHIEKKNTDKMNDALFLLQKEIEKEDEEV